MAKFETKKHTLFLRDGDFEFLATVFEHKNLKASYVIRQLVSRYVDSLKAQMKPEGTEDE